jgi:TRAP-type C4-dicarboxylate transport system permease small subunit
MKAIWPILDRLEKKMRALAAVCLVGMVVITCSDITMRFFDNPIFGSEEIVSFLLTLVIALSLPYSHLEKIHVGVEILFRLLKPRVQIVLKTVTDIMSLFLMVAITVMMFSYWYDTWQSGEVSMNLEFPEYYIILGLAVCFFCLNFFIIRDIIIIQDVKELVISANKEKGDA